MESEVFDMANIHECLAEDIPLVCGVPPDDM
jgi:hypothetical protein